MTKRLSLNFNFRGLEVVMATYGEDRKTGKQIERQTGRQTDKRILLLAMNDRRQYTL